MGPKGSQKYFLSIFKRHQILSIRLKLLRKLNVAAQNDTLIMGRCDLSNLDGVHNLSLNCSRHQR